MLKHRELESKSVVVILIGGCLGSVSVGCTSLVWRQRGSSVRTKENADVRTLRARDGRYLAMYASG